VKRIHTVNTLRAGGHKSTDSKRLTKARKAKESKSKASQKTRSWIDPFEVASQKLLAWRSRPRIHSWDLMPEPAAKLVRILGSDQRVTLFKELSANYRKVPSLENYLHLRRSVPEAELDVNVFGTDAIFALDPELKKHGIDIGLVVGALGAYEPDIDELSLRLMECLVARDKLPKSVPDYLEKHRQAIGDALVDYLIVTMLEGRDWEKGNPVVIPPSLVVLIRDRLCGSSPDLHKFLCSQEEQENVVFRAARYFRLDEKITSRKLAAVASVSRSTAARWLADDVFRQKLERARKLIADFQRKSNAFIKSSQSQPPEWP
jgi:hypothetical protein